MDKKDIEFQSFLINYKKHTSALKIKNSIQRDYILKVLYHCKKHLSAEEIAKNIKEQYNLDVGIVTIYNALKFFEEINLVKSLSIGNNPKKYELNLFDHHDHLICTKCYKIVEFSDEEIEQRQRDISKKHNFLIQKHEMILYGLCENCNN
ncbi:MAG: transcriptional repressor [Arcobacter sp.]|nr:transcriptional repressor [Arcobacter sp.]